MENPFEIIEQRLKNIENQLSELLKMAKAPILKEVTEEIMTVEQLSDYFISRNFLNKTPTCKSHVRQKNPCCA